jgi:hypothetical protein
MEVPIVPVDQASLDTLDEMLVVDYIRSYETRARNCAKEIEAAFKDKSLPGLDW